MGAYSQLSANPYPRYTIGLVGIHGPRKTVLSDLPALKPLLSPASQLSAPRRLPASDVLGLPQHYSDSELRAVSKIQRPDERHLDITLDQSAPFIESLDTRAPRSCSKRRRLHHSAAGRLL